MKSMTTKPGETKPGTDLLAQVRGGFITQGNSLSKWCGQNGICRVWASDVLRGKRNGPKAQQLRHLLISEACIDADG